MKVKDFLDTIERNKDIFKDCLDKEISVQMYTSNGSYIGNSFTLEYAGYKFSPWYKDSGNLVLDIRIIDKG